MVARVKNYIQEGEYFRIKIEPEWTKDGRLLLCLTLQFHPEEVKNEFVYVNTNTKLRVSAGNVEALSEIMLRFRKSAELEIKSEEETK